MLRIGFVLARVPFHVVALGLLSLQGPVRGQVDAHGRLGPDSPSVHVGQAGDETSTPVVAPTVFVGRVLGPDGAPAAGAVVVTGAGGQTVTNAAGAFSLEVEVPMDTESVRVTAVLGSGPGSLLGNVQVVGLTPWGATSAGTVIPEQAAACQPSWLPSFGQVPGTNGSVHALTAFDDGGDPALYVGGGFTSAGGVAANYIVKWSDSSWSPLGIGVGGGTLFKGKFSGYYAPTVNALTIFDDGSGRALYAGGNFTIAGDVAANWIAKWNGSAWSVLEGGMGGAELPWVQALAVFDDGGGPALFAGGYFITAGGVTTNGIARWDGSNWSALGSGMGGTFPPLVSALAVFDDGSGPALYAGGRFTSAGGVAANDIAKWNGTRWSALGSGIDGGPFTNVSALAVFDDGSGPALYTGGDFTTAGGVAADYIAKWDGSTWSPLGSGMNNGIFALTVFDDGRGPTLCAGGYFFTAGGNAAYNIATWDGTNWSPLGSGMNHWVKALAVYDDGSGPALCAGGDFTTAGDVVANYLAKWGCPPPSPLWTDLGFALPGTNGTPQLAGLGELTPGSTGRLTLTSAAPSAPAILFLALDSTPAPFKCGTLVPAPVLTSFVVITSPIGEVLLGWSSWPAGLSGLSLYFQYGIQDAAAVCGVALSNALRADVP